MNIVLRTVHKLIFRMLCVDRLNKHNYWKSFDTRINFEFIKFYINMTGFVSNERLWGTQVGRTIGTQNSPRYNAMNIHVNIAI